MPIIKNYSKGAFGSLGLQLAAWLEQNAYTIGIMHVLRSELP